MIRQALTTVLCAAVFTLITFVIPAHSEHPSSAPYFCTTMEAAMETVTLQQADDMEAIRDKAISDPNFLCWIETTNTPFMPLELVRQYRAFGAERGVIKAVAPDGFVVYLFGTLHFINWLMHQEGA